MRVEPHGIGSILHILKRGTRGVPIVRDEKDRTNFMRSLYYLNDSNFHEHWKRDTARLDSFEWPQGWEPQEPLVDILAWTLLPNHFHILVQERVEGGTAKFMQRVCGSMTKTFNQKYKEKGSLFQSSYKGKTVSKDVYFRQLVWYILVKNTLDCYPGGIAAALKNFDKAWQWGIKYRFSSFGQSVQGSESPIIQNKDGLVTETCRSPHFKKDAKAFLKLHQFRSKELEVLALEDW
jgi:putative transposase